MTVLLEAEFLLDDTKNASEVVRAGLRLLEEEENKTIVLRDAIQEGIDSGIAHDFNPKTLLKNLKAKKIAFI